MAMEESNKASFIIPLTTLFPSALWASCTHIHTLFRLLARSPARPPDRPNTVSGKEQATPRNSARRQTSRRPLRQAMSLVYLLVGRASDRATDRPLISTTSTRVDYVRFSTGERMCRPLVGEAGTGTGAGAGSAGKARLSSVLKFLLKPPIMASWIAHPLTLTNSDYLG